MNTLKPDIFEQVLEPGVRYFDATELMIEMARRMQSQQAQIERMQDDMLTLSNLVNRLANAAVSTAKRQVEMRADLLKAGAFEKKSAILRPGDMK